VTGEVQLGGNLQLVVPSLPMSGTHTLNVMNAANFSGSFQNITVNSAASSCSVSATQEILSPPSTASSLTFAAVFQGTACDSGGSASLPTGAIVGIAVAAVLVVAAIAFLIVFLLYRRLKMRVLFRSENKRDSRFIK